MIRKTIFFVLIFYNIQAQEPDPDCNFNQRLSALSTRRIQSPNYPSNYAAGRTCRWILRCPYGFTVRLTCTLRMPDSPNCNEDALLISRTGDNTLTGAERYCGNRNITNLGSFENRLTAGLTIPENSNGGAFTCTVRCQRSASQPLYCRCGERKQTRIIGGNETGVNEYTMMVGITEVGIDDEVRCGGAILTPNWCISAAHCFFSNNEALNPSTLELRVGNYRLEDATVYGVQRIVINPNYDPKLCTRWIPHILTEDQKSLRTNWCCEMLEKFNGGDLTRMLYLTHHRVNYINDVALLRASSPIQFNANVGPACLPYRYRLRSFVNDTVTILGWGLTDVGGPTSDTLMEVDVRVISLNQCQQSYNYVSQRNLCTQTPNKDSCQMDSGGPIQRPSDYSSSLILVALVSFGRDCASPLPSVNTRVSQYLNWITNIISNSNRFDVLCSKR